MTTKYEKMSTPDLIAEFNSVMKLHVEGHIKRASEILVVLHARGERLPAMREGVLRWFAPLAEGTLTPKAAITFAGVGSIVRKLIGCTPELQDRLANGEKISVAVHNNAGEIVIEQRTLLQLTTRQLDLVFDEGSGLRGTLRQKRLLAQRKPDVRRSTVAINIRADAATGEIVCGQMRFKPDQLTAALKDLGFKIERLTPPKKSR